MVDRPRRRFRSPSNLRAAAAESGVRWVELGAIVGTHGLRGGLRVKQYNPDSELFARLREVALRQAGEFDIREIKDARATGKGLLVQLVGVETIEAAEALRGAALCVPRSLLPRLPEGEYYHVDLEGLRAEAADGQQLGTVERVVEYPASQVLCVRGADGVREVPMREPYLVAVELEQGKVVIDHWDELDVQS